MKPARQREQRETTGQTAACSSPRDRALSRILAVALIVVFNAGSAFGGCGKNVTPYTDPVCGNDRQEYGEECDGSDLDGQTCAGLGLESGDLACGADCRFNVTDCTSEAVCDNGVIEYPEDCEGADLDGTTCEDLGFTGGTLACTNACTFDTSMCEMTQECGDGAVAPPEECDGDNLDGQTCESLGLGAGTLGCMGNCTFDVSGCPGTADCGNGEIEYPEDCEGADLDGQTCQSLGHDGGTLACGQDCAFDQSGCTDCGDGVAEGDEECDGTDLAGATCESLSHDGGTLACAGDCTFEVTGCTDCGPGLTYCDGDCVDTLTDSSHCGSCLDPCAPNEICVSGSCKLITGLPWSVVGTNPIDGGSGADAHDLATDGTNPTVAYVMSGNVGVRVAQYTGVPAWDMTGSLPSAAWPTLNNDPAVAIEFSGTTPYVMFSADYGSMGGGIVHVMARQAAGWQEVGAPGYESPCMSHWFMDLSLDQAAPHVITYGAGGCGLGIDYAWWDGAAWQVHPSTTGFPGQITMSGGGNPSIVFTDQAYVGVPEGGDHTVKYWDDVNNVWTSLGGPLGNTSNTSDTIAMTTDPAGNIYAAWSEGMSEIYVKQYRVDLQTWIPLGIGSASGAGNASFPSITIIGSAAWLAHVEEDGLGFDEVIVRRFDDVSGTWQQVGQRLNIFLVDGAAPVIVGIGGVPYVAWRESGSLWVKHYNP